jgi:hypothetical protein
MCVKFHDRASQEFAGSPLGAESYYRAGPEDCQFSMASPASEKLWVRRIQYITDDVRKLERLGERQMAQI